MIRKVFVIAVFSLALTSVFAAWEPPVGIPHPPFGITNSHWTYTNSAYTWDYGSGPQPYRRNEHGPYTHYVDRSNPSATDSNNPFGTPERPRLTWPYPLPAGSAVQVHGGPYNFKNGPGSKLAFGGTGTAERPIFLYGTTTNRSEMATIASGECYFFGNWTIVERLAFLNDTSGNTRPLLKGAPVINMCIRDCYFRGTGQPGNATCISVAGPWGSSAQCYTENLIVLRNEMHNYGSLTATTENDACGIIAGVFTTNAWILDNAVYNMGGDSIRIGADQGDAPSGSRYYVGRNHFYDNRENGIDVKQARNAVISENVIHGFRPVSSSAGEAVVIHYAPENIWFLNNTIYDAERGINSSGVGTDCYLIGNTIFNCNLRGLYLDRGGGRFHVLNNTVTSCGNGIITSGIVDGLVYKNNIISQIASTGYHLQLESTALAASAIAERIMFYQSGSAVRIRWGGATYSSVLDWMSRTGKGSGSTTQNPNVISGTSQKLSAESPAIDAGVSITDYDNIFRSSFGVSMLRDADGDIRPSGAAWDIGADEFANVEGRPTPPQNLRISN